MIWTIPLITERNMSEGLQEVFYYVNQESVSWGLFSPMFLLALYIIVLVGYVGYQRDDFMGGFAIAGFIVMVTGTLMRIANLLSTPFLLIAVGLGIVGLAGLYYHKKDS